MSNMDIPMNLSMKDTSSYKEEIKQPFENNGFSFIQRYTDTEKNKPFAGEEAATVTFSLAGQNRSEAFLKESTQKKENTSSAVTAVSDTDVTAETSSGKGNFDNAFFNIAKNISSLTAKESAGSENSGGKMSEDYSLIGKMNGLYNHYKEQIEQNYTGAQKNAQLAALNKSYKKVFRTEILSGAAGYHISEAV